MYSGWICPVCGRRNFSASVCGTCGFDDSRDYEKYPTLSPIPSGTPSVETLRRLRQIEQSFDGTSAQHSAPPSSLAERLDAIEKKFDALTTKLDTVLQSSQGETSVEPAPKPKVTPPPKPVTPPESKPVTPPPVKNTTQSKTKHSHVYRIFLLAVVLIAVAVAAFAYHKYGDNVLYSGECGDNVTWTLTANGTLTVSGRGEMYDYSYGDYSPWYEQREQIQRAVIEYGVTTIGDDAFLNCTSLSSITIPDSVTTIGGFAFSGCTSLSSVTIPDSVTTIGEYAFFDCFSLSSVTIPDSVTSIGHSAFAGCTSLSSVTIPDSVTSIRNWTFKNCTSLSSVSIPDSVTTIGRGAFYGCTSLSSVSIPANVTLGEDAFPENTTVTRR